MFNKLALLLKENGFVVIFSFLLCTIHIMPLLFAGVPATMKLALWMIFVVYMLSHSIIHIDKSLTTMLTCSSIFVVIAIFYSIVGVSDNSISGNLGFSLFLFPIVCLVCIYAKCNTIQIKFLFHILCIITVLNILDSIRLSILYPMVTYQMMAGELETEGLVGLNLGGSPFVSMTVFFLNVVIFAYNNTNKLFEKLLFLVYIVITLLFELFYSFKASIVIYSLMSIVMHTIMHRAKNKQQAILLSCIIALPITLCLDEIIHFIVNAIGSDRIASRLLLFADTDNSAASDGSISTRTELWMVSLRSWLSNPITFIFGIGNHARSEGLATSATGIGNHSDFLDTLARYGIIGGILLYKILKNLYHYLIDRFDFKFKSEIIVFFIVIVFFGLTKKIMAGNIAIMIFVMFPLSLMYIESSQDQ